MLPTEIQETIHMLFIIMWATGCTPKAWKISNTILIDKNKGDETEASSYRPIGLANTLYIQTMDASNHKHSLRICRSKLYTQHHASWFSQTERPHSPARKRDYGTRRCQTLSQRHLCPYCGFTSAFNTTDHDRMLWIMYDLVSRLTP
jgi:hypothetical protein